MSEPILMPVYALSNEQLVWKALSPFRWGYRLQAGPYTLAELRWNRGRTAEKELMLISHKDSISIQERGTKQELALFKPVKKEEQRAELLGTLALASGETLSWCRLQPPRSAERVWRTSEGEELIACWDSGARISPGAALHPELSLLLVVGMYLLDREPRPSVSFDPGPIFLIG